LYRTISTGLRGRTPVGHHLSAEFSHVSPSDRAGAQESADAKRIGRKQKVEVVAEKLEQRKRDSEPEEDHCDPTPKSRDPNWRVRHRAADMNHQEADQYTRLIQTPAVITITPPIATA
jgi:hypothetical protein